MHWQFVKAMVLEQIELVCLFTHALQLLQTLFFKESVSELVLYITCRQYVLVNRNVGVEKSFLLPCPCTRPYHSFPHCQQEQKRARLIPAKVYFQLKCTCSFPDLGATKQVTQINVKYKYSHSPTATVPLVTET